MSAIRKDGTRTAAVASAALATHLTALGAGFVWLDHAHLEEGGAIARPGHWLELFTHGFAGTGFYRPLMALSLSIDALVSGPFVFHATSLAWHAAASVATVAASEALGLRRRAALVAGGLFAVHPLSALVAGAIAFRSEAMVATFLLGFVWAHVRRRSTLAALLLVAACLTKEIAFGLAPLFVLAIELLGAAPAPGGDDPAPRNDASARPVQRASRQSAKGRARGGAPKHAAGAKEAPAVRAAVLPAQRLRGLLGVEALAFAAALALRASYAPAFRAAHSALGAGDAVGTRLAALAKTAAAVVLPVDRMICDAFPVTHLSQPTSLVGLVVAAGVGVLAWRRRGPALLLAIALVPSLQLVPVMRWWSPHYVYVPLAFVAMLVAAVVERRGTRALQVTAVVAAVLGGVTLTASGRYESDQTLWAPEVVAQPACLEGQFFLGEVDRQAHRWEDAALHYEAALAPHPGMLAYVDRGAALQNLGTVRLEQERFDDARVAFRAALEGTGSEAARRELVHNLAAIALRRGDAAEAERLLASETARPDALPASLVVRAMALRQLGREQEATELLTRVPR